MTNDHIRVYLLDDHEVVRRGLHTLLEGAGDVEVIGESGSAVEAARQILALTPDVAVLDMRLPDGSGIDVCREVRSVDPTIRALILTSYDEDEALVAAILGGASGYVIKGLRSIDLVASIRQVAAGRSLLDPVLVARVLEQIRNPDTGRPGSDGLTEDELQISTCIAAGLTNRQMAERLVLTERTVEDHVSSILFKLGFGRRSHAATQSP